MTRTWRIRILVGLVLLVVLAQFYRPDPGNPPIDPAWAVDAAGAAPADVVATLKRSCFDCHSNATRWPWYSRVAPMSWIIADHVREGRSQVNFSEFNRYTAKERLRRLDKMCAEVKEGGMPLGSYLPLHSDAKLSEGDVRSICDWTASESARIENEVAAAAMPAFAPVASHGDLVYASGVLPRDTATAIAGQTAQVLAELGLRLTAAGTSLARVAAATVYLARAEDFAGMNAIWAKCFPADPPTRTTVVVPLARRGALIQVSAIAAAPGASRDVLLPKGWLKSPSPYSYGIRVGDTLFLAGLVSRRGADNTAIPGDMTAQTRAVFANAQAILAEAGLSFSDIAAARVFVTDAAAFEAMNTVYRTYFPKAPPARATVKTALTSQDYLVEITFTAVKGGARTAIVTPNADGTPGKPNPNLSSAIGVGPRLFLSGMLGMLPGNAADAMSQTGETLTRLERTLTAGGLAWTHVVDSVVYVTDVSSAAAVLAAMQTRTGGRLPVGTVVGSGLMSPDGRVEIMLTAGR